MSVLAELASGLAGGKIRVIDLTQTLSPEFPSISLPPEMGQAWPFRIEEVSRYDERGPAWYWNNFSCGEHTGTHFDAPIHWITGRDLPNNSKRPLFTPESTSQSLASSMMCLTVVRASCMKSQPLSASYF